MPCPSSPAPNCHPLAAIAKPCPQRRFPASTCYHQIRQPLNSPSNYGTGGAGGDAGIWRRASLADECAHASLKMMMNDPIHPAAEMIMDAGSVAGDAFSFTLAAPIAPRLVSRLLV